MTSAIGSTASGPGSRGNNFDLLRHLLATMVIFSHSYPLANGDASSEPLMRLSGGKSSLGDVAVDGFFAISGFLITQSWRNDPNLSRYLKKRAARIYPGFLASCVFCAFVVGPVASRDAYRYWAEFPARDFAVSALILQGVSAPKVFVSNPYPGGMNDSLWTIRPEFVCYVGVAAMGLTGILRRRTAVLALLGVACSLKIAGDWTGLDIAGEIAGLADRITGSTMAKVKLERWVGLTPSWPRFASCFLAGSVLCLFREGVDYSPKRLAASSLACVACALVGWRSPPPYSYLWLTPAFVAGVYSLFAVAFIPCVRPSRFGGKADLSYGLYLYAFPVQQLIAMWSRGRIGPMAIFLVAFPITAALAFASWHLIERPFLWSKGRSPNA